MRDQLKKLKERQEFERASGEDSLMSEFISTAMAMAKKTQCKEDFLFEDAPPSQGYLLERYVAIPLER